ncbi:hypothetical protein AB0C76_04265 [Kitasatospora sp. NPDC048722]|uniref:hypothetical protein n=1 Tax=Kitasatospora sp. NPDC048722 TaxID=3155639 RepID=UPI003401EB44
MRRTVAVLLGASALLAATTPAAGAATAAAPGAQAAPAMQAGAPLFGMLGSASAMAFGAVDALKGAVKLP